MGGDWFSEKAMLLWLVKRGDGRGGRKSSCLGVLRNKTVRNVMPPLSTGRGNIKEKKKVRDRKKGVKRKRGEE